MANLDEVGHWLTNGGNTRDLYVVREPEAQTWVPLTFYALATSERYLHFGARATPKVS